MKRFIAIICLFALIVSMSTLGALSASAAEWISKAPANNVDYSFVVLGDIQTITYYDAHNSTSYLTKLFNWIIDNREARKIEYVIGLGDSVETLRSNSNGGDLNPKEWQKVRNRLRDLQNAGISHMVVRGNHDDERGYHKYVCTEDYVNDMDGFFYDEEKKATRGNSMSNCYRKLEIGNHKYLMLGLDYNAGEDAIEWANEIISENPDHKVILSIHSYLSGYGGYYKGNIGYASADFLTQESMYFNAEELWKDLVSKHENMFMVLCGHCSTTSPIVKVSTGNNGNKIYNVLVDPQTYEEKDPSGFVFIINITHGGTKIEFEYFSTAKKQYFGENNQFSLTLADGTLPPFEKAVVTEPITTEVTTTVVPTTEATTVATTTEVATTAEPTTEAITTTVLTTVATTTEATATSTATTASTAVVTTTAEPTTETTALAPITEATAATSDLSNSDGCGSAVTSTVAVCCSMGTALAAFAMRKKKED